MDTDIFISYRRDDEPAFVRHLYDFLKTTFPHHAVFIDVEAIPPGDKFAEHIISRLLKCSVFLPVIGRQWLSNRLFEHGDLVKEEIKAALVFKTTIIPILVDNTPMPSPDTVPRTIAGICAINAVRLSHARFHDDAKPLIKAIKGVIKHHIEKHFTIAQFEAGEIGKKLGADIANRISKGINAAFEKISKPMVERFITEIEPIILRRDGEAMQNMVPAFKDEVIRMGWEITGVCINFVCEDMPELRISPNEPHNPLCIAIEEHMRKEIIALSNVMMDQVAVTTANMIHNSGWDIIPHDTRKG